MVQPKSQVLTHFPSVGIVVLSWNNQRDTLECLQSLRALQYPFVRVILVDNASSDQTVGLVRQDYPEVEIIVNDRNLGYASGNNVGLKVALDLGFRYILVLNNDTLLAPDCLSELVHDLETRPTSAAAGPKILYQELSSIINFAGGGIDIDGLPYHVGAHQPDNARFGASCETPWLTGSAILFRADALRSVGFFEPRFFLLYEDVDWGLRARRRGYSLRWVADARLWHKESATFGRTWSPAYVYYFSRNRFLYLERNYQVSRWPHLFRAALSNLFHLVRTEIAPAGGGDEEYWRRVVYRGLTDYVLRRFGQRSYRWR